MYEGLFGGGLVDFDQFFPQSESEESTNPDLSECMEEGSMEAGSMEAGKTTRTYMGIPFEAETEFHPKN